MENVNNSQKKKIIFSVVYALIVALLIVAGVLTIINVNQPEISNTNADINVGNNDSVIVSTPSYVVPIKDAIIIKDYSATELQYNESLKQWEIHKAIDFQAGNSLDVLAFADGTINNVYNNYLEGTVIEISHKNGLVSVYKSLETANVKVGDKVGAGQVIGLLGNNMAQEQSEGKHLHFELLKDSKKINPHDYLDLGSK